ncbi:MAG: nitroreductase family protein [Chloroflexi bacterium]|nr:nitroreductase family protein [Chloroflexota bacterium]
MDTIEALRSRRSVKSYLSTPVSRETLQTLVDLARLSPSGANKNTWHFIVITRQNTLERLGQTHPNCKWLSSAPAGIAIVIDPTSTRYWLEDCSIAAYSIWVAATAQGLGAAWAAMYQNDNPTETARRQQFVRETLSIPDNLLVPVVLAIGYPESQPAAKPRPELKDIICWDGYAFNEIEKVKT